MIDYSSSSYGINHQNIGSSNRESGGDKPAKLQQIRNPSAAIYAGDTEKPDIKEGSYLAYDSNDNTSVGVFIPRHGNTCNIMWCDGHVESALGATHEDLYSKVLGSYRNVNDSNASKWDRY